MSRELLYVVVLGPSGRFIPALPERVEEAAGLLKKRHALAVCEKLNADGPASSRADLAGEEATQ